MRKRLLLIGIVLLAVICAVAIFLHLNLSGFRINSERIERIVLISRSYETEYDRVELNDDEIERLATLYNHSIYAGRVNVDRPYMTYWVQIYFTDGSTLFLRDYKDTKLYVTPSSGDRFWVDNNLLCRYIEDLMTEHGLARK